MSFNIGSFFHDCYIEMDLRGLPLQTVAERDFTIRLQTTCTEVSTQNHTTVSALPVAKLLVSSFGNDVYRSETKGALSSEMLLFFKRAINTKA